MLVRIILIYMLMVALIFAGCSKDEESTECTTTSFTFDGAIHPLCGIDAVGNHVQIKNLNLNSGSFYIYARTNPDGSGGGEFAFASGNVTATYRGGNAGSATNSADISKPHFLIGFHQENPAVHVVVKQADSVDALEDAAALLNIDSNRWANTGAPASESFYYKGNGKVTVESVKIFHEEHHH